MNKANDSKATTQQEMLKSILAAVKSSNNLPTDSMEYEYACSYPSFQKAVTLESSKIVDWISKTLKYYGMKSQLKQFELDDKFDYLVDANDSVLERVADLIDVASGKKKEESIDDNVNAASASSSKVSTQWNNQKTGTSGSVGPSMPQATVTIKSRGISKPQLEWVDKVDNTNSSQCTSKLTAKPNVLEPLQVSLSKGKHPYKYEIDNLVYEDHQLESEEPQQSPGDLSSTPLVYIDDVDRLDEVCRLLNYEREVAVDVEQHSYRSYQGFICLIQISTRRQDFIIDALTLRPYLNKLNLFFTNPKVVKIFHGSDHDILWLQRCARVYVVNMFDTYYAAKGLQHQRLSLAYLTKYYCDIDRDKSYQLADWRQRPLPDSMLQYAREDTHHLLYIYDCMKAELIDKAGGQSTSLLELALKHSNNNTLKVYNVPVWSDMDYLGLYIKSKKRFHGGQLHALSGLYKWRDDTAREEDESTGYVLPNHMLLHIADVLPREVSGVLACCNPVPTLVHHYLREIHQIVLAARAQAKVSEEEYFATRGINSYTLQRLADSGGERTQKLTNQGKGILELTNKSAKGAPEHHQPPMVNKGVSLLNVKPAPIKARPSLLQSNITDHHHQTVTVKTKSDLFDDMSPVNDTKFAHVPIRTVVYPEVVENFVSPYQLYVYGKMLEPDDGDVDKEQCRVDSNQQLGLLAAVPSKDELIINPTSTQHAINKLREYWNQFTTSSVIRDEHKSSNTHSVGNTTHRTYRGWYDTDKYDKSTHSKTKHETKSKRTTEDDKTRVEEREEDMSGSEEEDEETTLKDQLRRDYNHQQLVKKRKRGGRHKNKQGESKKQRCTEPVTPYDYSAQSMDQVFPGKSSGQGRKVTKPGSHRGHGRGRGRGNKRGGVSAGRRYYTEMSRRGGSHLGTSQRNMTSLSSSKGH